MQQETDVKDGIDYTWFSPKFSLVIFLNQKKALFSNCCYILHLREIYMAKILRPKYTHYQSKTKNNELQLVPIYFLCVNKIFLQVLFVGCYSNTVCYLFQRQLSSILNSTKLQLVKKKDDIPFIIHYP